ncbi:hypothetical protein MOQ72_29425 [Saccharopolyspora sp. K220]|nr:hypothetical protein [Saccharopolyspora soli]MCI2421563.1 hypothetical protein [Saccharopolyspora soli]
MTTPADSEFSEQPVVAEDSPSVTAKDQLWLLFIAIVPLVLATIWYVER